jgi:hypothetical protein
MNICVDCKHFMPAKYFDPEHQHARCSKASVQNLVNGIIKLQYCEVMRLAGSRCGLEGLMYQSKHEEYLDV